MGRAFLAVRRSFLPGAICILSVSLMTGRRQKMSRPTYLARGLRTLKGMNEPRATIWRENNALAERSQRVAGQDLRIAGQGLPGEARETVPCR